MVPNEKSCIPNINVPLSQYFRRCDPSFKRFLTGGWTERQKIEIIISLFLYARLQTGRIIVWWCPSGSPSVHPSVRSPSARFPHFSPTCFDILSWNFAHDFVLMYYRSSLSVITLRQFLKELCLFVNLEYGKYTVFRTFLLHALTYWAEILHMTLFWCTTEQVRVSSLCVNFWRSYDSFGTLNIGNTQFSVVFSCMLWHIELKFCTWLCFNILQSKFECCHFSSIFEGVKLLCGLSM